MRVLHVLGPLSTGGAQTQLHGLIRAANGRYWDASLCATSSGALSPMFRDLGVPMIELRRRASPGIGRIVKLRRHITHHDYDLVNAHLWQSNAYARLAVAIRRQRPATLIVEHNVEVDRSPARRLADQVLDRWTDGHVAVTDAMATFVRTHHSVPPGALHFLPYAIDKQTFRPDDTLRSRDRLVIGSMGRLDPEKGFHILIDAVGRLVADGRAVELRIAGTGALEAQLRIRAAGLPVEFVGAVSPGKGAASFLRELDVFVLASTHREARPVVVLEALSCGVPVVATDIPGMAETTAGGGTIVPPGDSAAIAKAVIGLHHRPDEARRRAIKAAGTILDFDALAALYAKAFDDVISRRRAAL